MVSHPLAASFLHLPTYLRHKEHRILYATSDATAYGDGSSSTVEGRINELDKKDHWLSNLSDVALLQKQRVWKESASVSQENSVFLRADVEVMCAVWCGKAAVTPLNLLLPQIAQSVGDSIGDFGCIQRIIVFV